MGTLTSKPNTTGEATPVHEIGEPTPPEDVIDGFERYNVYLYEKRPVQLMKIDRDPDTIELHRLDYGIPITMGRAALKMYLKPYAPDTSEAYRIASLVMRLTNIHCEYEVIPGFWRCAKITNVRQNTFRVSYFSHDHNPDLGYMGTVWLPLRTDKVAPLYTHIPRQVWDKMFKPKKEYILGPYKPPQRQLASTPKVYNAFEYKAMMMGHGNIEAQVTALERQLNSELPKPEIDLEPTVELPKSEELPIPVEPEIRAEVLKPELPPEPSKPRAECPLCANPIDRIVTSFSCGHSLCPNCAIKIDKCHECREVITSRQRVYLP